LFKLNTPAPTQFFRRLIADCDIVDFPGVGLLITSVETLDDGISSMIPAAAMRSGATLDFDILFNTFPWRTGACRTMGVNPKAAPEEADMSTITAMICIVLVVERL
jgi:hypothetical protein